MNTPLLGRGGGGFGGGARPAPRPAGRPAPRPAPRSVPRAPTRSRSGPSAVNHTTVTNHVTNVHVYGGRAYTYRGGGWGYGYYGPHPYFDSWYGYPIYYGYPGHWSGWDWPLGILVVLLLVGGVVAAGRRWMP